MKHYDYRNDYGRVSSGSFVQDKNFYVLTLLQTDAVRSELSRDSQLARILAAHTTGLPPASWEKISDSPESVERSKASALAMAFSEEDIDLVKTELARRVADSAPLQALVRNHLRPSGTYERLAGMDDASMLAHAWAQAVQGVHQVIGQFALGMVDIGWIDGASYRLEDPAYQRSILDAREAAVMRVRGKPGALFFEPSLDFALRLMAINRRDEAARHEPLESGENRLAMQAMRKTQWFTYQYAALLVHGQPPEGPGIALGVAGRQNCAAAADLYRRGMAPFIIVSGGYVHPKQSIFSEAVEMKRELVLGFGIPEAAILIDPHARHTTTNVRNGVRILFAGGAPEDKPSLSVSTPGHIGEIASPGFVERCQHVFGYQPAHFGKRIGDVAVEFTPSRDSLHIDPSDPLDP